MMLKQCIKTYKKLSTMCFFFLGKYNHRDSSLCLQHKRAEAGFTELGAYRCVGFCPAEDTIEIASPKIPV